jgi:uncharacterized protein (TIGR02996 family)
VADIVQYRPGRSLADKVAYFQTDANIWGAIRDGGVQAQDLLVYADYLEEEGREDEAQRVRAHAERSRYLYHCTIPVGLDWKDRTALNEYLRARGKATIPEGKEVVTEICHRTKDRLKLLLVR